MSRKIHLVYFKESGKYYSEGNYQSELYNDYDVYKEVGLMGQFPGLSSWGWNGFILVQPEYGVPAILKAKYIKCES